MMPMEKEKTWCVVTGGRGFVGRHVVEMLIRHERFFVRITDLQPAIQLNTDEENGVLREALKSGLARYVQADLRNKAQAFEAIEGTVVVFHMAAPDSSINDHRLHYSVNVEGTQNVIDACFEYKVKRLIYTSSASVVFAREILHGDESLPYSSQLIDSYSATKAEAEAAVIKVNGAHGLLTCCLRPSSVFGPGDKLFIPSLASSGRAGKSKFMIGDGNNVFDFTYVENVAHAHICAERALASPAEVASEASGQAYFITNMEPCKFWEFVSLVLEGLGYERPTIRIPVFVMMPIAYVVEMAYKMLRPFGMRCPQLIPSRIRLISSSRIFDCSKAKRLLGYEPIISMKDGLEETIQSFSHLRADKEPRRRSSRISNFLGHAKVAALVLWKDKKMMMMSLIVLIALHCCIAPSHYTIIAMLTMLFLIVLFIFLIQANNPGKM